MNNRFHIFKKGNNLISKQDWIVAEDKKAAQAMSGGGEYTGSRINPAELPAGTRASRWLILGGAIKTKAKLKP